MNAADTPQPFVTDYEDAPAYWSIGILWNVLISADQSFGNFTLMDQTMPEGAGPPSHMHERMHEGFYVIEGQITYSVGPDDDKITAGPGAAVWIPPGTPHAFTVTSGPARALNFYTPGGFMTSSPTSPPRRPTKPFRRTTCPPLTPIRRPAISTGSVTSIKRQCSPRNRSGDANIKPSGRVGRAFCQSPGARRFCSECRTAGAAVAISQPGWRPSGSQDCHRGVLLRRDR